MIEYKDGEHIFLHFEDYENEEFFRGWVDLDSCKSSIKSTYGQDCQIKSVKRQSYARWCFGRDILGDRIMTLVEVDRPARGAFKVTICESARCY